jgi:hypothetical protein
MIRKGSMKLLMYKLASSSYMDLMYDLNDDPFEVRNLLSPSSAGRSTDVQTIAQAEHLRCLLLDWMTRMDTHPSTGWTMNRYYSDPKSNYFEDGNQGDIAEIRQRQSWPLIGFWTSHSETNPLTFGQLSTLPDGSLMRHEWLYVGTRLETDKIIIDQIDIVGDDAQYFSTDQSSVMVFGGELPPNDRKGWQQNCHGIRITFEIEALPQQPQQQQQRLRRQFEARIVFTFRSKSTPTEISIVAVVS